MTLKQTELFSLKETLSKNQLPIVSNFKNASGDQFSTEI